MERATGKRPKELDGPDLPPNTGYLWDWFMDLTAERHFEEGVPLPLTSQQIESWARMNRVSLRLWEYRALRRLDAEFRADAIKVANDRARAAANKQKASSSVGMTIGMGGGGRW